MNPAACASNSMSYSMKPNRACKHLFLAPLTGLVSPAVMIFVNVDLFFMFGRYVHVASCFGVVLVCFAQLRNKANSANNYKSCIFFMHHRNITCISCEVSSRCRVCTSSTRKFKSSSTSKSCHLATIVKCLKMPIWAVIFKYFLNYI